MHLQGHPAERRQPQKLGFQNNPKEVRLPSTREQTRKMKPARNKNVEAMQKIESQHHGESTNSIKERVEFFRSLKSDINHWHQIWES